MSAFGSKADTMIYTWPSVVLSGLRRSDMFGIFATIKIKPDQRDGFLGTIKETAFRSVSDEPGCLRFDVFQDLADENRYILYEVYTDEEAFKEHLSTSHARSAMERSRDWAEKGFEVTRAVSVYPNAEQYFATRRTQ
jgi:quinol monooxygenase YgiN